jgi:hypothetical protein
MAAATSVLVPAFKGRPSDDLGLVPYSEIGRKLGIPTEEVREIYRSAMKKLRARPAVLQQLRDLASGLHNSPITETNEDLD